MTNPKLSPWAGALLALAVTGGAAQAQWSIGPAGPHVAPPGENRYIYFVRTNPLAGFEQAFDDVYQNQHMGDLVQFPGWEGAQRFRLAADVQPHPTAQGYRYGYLIIWEKQGAKLPDTPQVGEAIAGGKSRRIPGFDYGTPGASWSATYKLLGAKLRRPDGLGPFMPPLSDNKTPRPNRYVLLEFDNVPAGVADGEFQARLDKRIAQVLKVPGWMAAQRAVLEPTPAGREAAPADKYLTVWEYEGHTAQEAQDALTAATKAGQVDAMPREAASAESSYWLPISPYITKDDFVR